MFFLLMKWGSLDSIIKIPSSDLVNKKSCLSTRERFGRTASFVVSCLPPPPVILPMVRTSLDPFLDWLDFMQGITFLKDGDDSEHFAEVCDFIWQWKRNEDGSSHISTVTYDIV